MDASPLQLLLAGDVKGATIERISQVSENRTSILGIKHSYVMILFEICSYIIILLLIAYNTTKNRIILFFLILYLLVFILFNICIILIFYTIMFHPLHLMWN